MFVIFHQRTICVFLIYVVSFLLIVPVALSSSSKVISNDDYLKDTFKNETEP